MAGLFGDNFNPNTGWLGSVLQQQDQPQDQNSVLSQILSSIRPPGGAVDNIITNTKNGMDNLGGAGNILSTVASPYNPMMWLNPAPMVGNMIAGGARELAQPPGGPPAPPSQGDSPREQNGAFPGMMLPGQPAAQPAPQPGPTLDQRAYGMPAPSPQQALAAPQQMPPQAAQSMAQAPQSQQPEAGLGDRLSAGFQGFARGGAPLPALANLIGGFATGQRQDAAGKTEQNQTQMAQAVAAGLQKQGYPPQVALAIAKAAATDPKIAEKLLGDAFGLPKTAEELAVRRASMPGGGQGQGNPFDILKQKSAAVKAGETQGERTGNAELDLPSAVAQANEQLRLTNELKTHKGRDNGVFWHSKVGGYLPDSAIPGNTDARDAVGILNSIKGGAFLEAFKTLKGGGQITEVEGKKATDAIARMDRSQSRAEFDRALSDYQGVIKLGVDRASQVAGQQPPNQFKGNSDWQQVGPGVRIRQVQ